MKGVLKSQDTRTAGATVPAGDLEGGLVGLGPGVGQEDPGVVCGPAREGQGDELLGKTDLCGGGEEVRDVSEGGDLGGHGLDDCGMSVPQAVDGNPGQQIGVLLAVGVPEVGPLPAHQDPAGGAEGVHDGVGVAVQPGGAGPVSGGSRCWRARF